MSKPRHEKKPQEMNFEEFTSWATSHILFGIGQGNTLRDLVQIIMIHAAENTVWAGRNNDE